MNNHTRNRIEGRFGSVRKVNNSNYFWNLENELVSSLRMQIILVYYIPTLII